MTVTLGVLNLVLGTVYTCYGLMTIVDLRRGWSTQGFSHFGMAWIAMAFTCGPHHLDHAIHSLVVGRMAGPLDLAAVIIGLPVGVVWFLLRVEALFGGAGDRFIAGTPRALAVAPVVGVVAAGSILSAAATVARGHGLNVQVLPNLFLLALYGAIAVVLTATQLRNHLVTGGWSLSGVSLAAVMFTCGQMHAVYAAYGQAGVYVVDTHGLTVAVASVPAAIYFLWVVVALHRGQLRDWNRRASLVSA